MSEPSATLTWLFDGKPTGVHGPVYVIPSIKVSDSGMYSCTAVNAASERNQTSTHEVAVGGMEHKWKTDTENLCVSKPMLNRRKKESI